MGKKTMADTLKMARLDVSYTQSQLAKKLGCTEGYIAHMETGRSLPSETKLLQLCDLLLLNKREMLRLRQQEKADDVALPYYKELAEGGSINESISQMSDEQMAYALKIIRAIEENKNVKTAIDLIIGDD